MFIIRKSIPYMQPYMLCFSSRTSVFARQIIVPVLHFHSITYQRSCASRQMTALLNSMFRETWLYCQSLWKNIIAKSYFVLVTLLMVKFWQNLNFRFQIFVIRNEVFVYNINKLITNSKGQVPIEKPAVYRLLRKLSALYASRRRLISVITKSRLLSLFIAKPIHSPPSNVISWNVY